MSNLIYNGNFASADSWSATTLSVADGVATITGDLVQNTAYLVPVSNGRRYRLKFDLKVTSNCGSAFYIALRPYDNNKAMISISSVNKPWSNTETTLASALANGDTTVTLTSATNWRTDTYSQIGIINKLAWGNKRASYTQPWSTLSGNTITLKSAWAGGSWAAGTNVAEFRAGSTYFYPWQSTSANLPTDWTTYSAEFDGGDAMRYTCKYFLFSTIGYTHEYQMRNISIECINDYQDSFWYDGDINVDKAGIFHAENFNDIGMKIRYVRDTITGSTANTANHWCEFQIFNHLGENLAWGKDINAGGRVYANSVATDGTVNSSYVDGGSGTKTARIDLGYHENIHKIKIWHYYPDGRTYHNNIVEVSVDGATWYPVYVGEKPETSEGNEIILSPAYASLSKNGEAWASDFIEY